MGHGERPRGHAQVAPEIHEADGGRPEARERADADGHGEEQEGEDGRRLDEEDVEIEAAVEGPAAEKPHNHKGGQRQVERELRGHGHGCMKTMKLTTVATMSTQANQMCRCNRLTSPITETAYARTDLR